MFIIAAFIAFWGSRWQLRSVSLRAERLGNRFLRPNWFTSVNSVIKRARWISQSAAFLMVWHYTPFFLTIASAVGFAIYLGSLNFIGSTVITFGLSTIFGYFLNKRKKEDARLWILIVAAKRVCMHANSSLAFDFLRELSESQDPDLRIAAINGWMEMHPNVGLKVLERMSNDLDLEVKIAAKEAHQELSAVASGKRVHRVDLLPRLVDEYKTWKQQSLVPGLSQSAARANLQMTVARIDNVVYTQLAHKIAYPALYCKNCNARAEEVTEAEWTWIRCRLCKDAVPLELGVETVIGTIGGATPPAETIDGLRYLSLWNESRKTALQADIDILVIQGGDDMNYDWAISAVGQALQHRLQPDAAPIQLRLIDAPSLDRNTELLLDSFASKALDTTE